MSGGHSYLKGVCRQGSCRLRMLTCQMPFASNIDSMSLRNVGRMLQAKSSLEVDRISAELGLYDGEVDHIPEAPGSWKTPSR